MESEKLPSFLPMTIAHTNPYACPFGWMDNSGNCTDGNFAKR